MNPSAQSLIADLDPQPPPEGGYYREFALLGCYVGPGFDFSDFRMAKVDVEMRRIIAQQGETFAACL